MLSIMTQKYSPLPKLFDKVLIRLVDGGIAEHSFLHYIPLAARQMSKQMPSQGSNLESLHLQPFFTLFMFLFAGLFASTMSFAKEVARK